MAIVRAMVKSKGAEMGQSAGNRQVDGRQLYAVDGDNQAIPSAAIVAGIVRRTGTTAATADTLPALTTLLAALSELERGDSIMFAIRMDNAHANTVTVGAGMTAVGTKDVAASSTREYLLTLTSDNKSTRVVSGTTTNTSLILSNISDTDLQNVGIGMAVTGTGVGASAKVTAINYGARTIAVSVASTATADNIALTFTPQADLLGVRTAGN